MPILNRFIVSRPILFFAALLLLIPLLALFIPAVIQGFYAEWFAGILVAIVALKIVKKEDW